MPRHERAPRETAGAPPAKGTPLKLNARRGADGRLEIDAPGRELKATVEAAERPPTPDDPRPAGVRNIPPYGAGV
jgi:hypothetical protein